VVLGPHDVNLHQIELAYPGATITARGERISVSGSLQDFQEIRSIFQDLSGIARRTSQITERDVRTVLTIRQRARAARAPRDTDEMPATRTGLPSPAGIIPPVTTPEEAGVIVYTHGGGAVKAKTAGQQRIVTSHQYNDIVFAIGPAGTGKTYTAVALAVKALKERRVKRIVLCRPAVEAGESLGFLPGDLKDKIDPYLRPLYDSLEEMIDHDRLELNITKNIIEIVPLAYMRGRTLNNAFVILDEAQNATTTQMKMFLTRLGLNSKAIITGDVTQTDLPKKANSGLIEIPRILGNIKGIDFIYLDQSDVVRHKLIRDIIEAYEKYEGKK
jgi:phosphate starvation-inducible protein PhoH and related proteins